MQQTSLLLSKPCHGTHNSNQIQESSIAHLLVGCAVLWLHWLWLHGGGPITPPMRRCSTTRRGGGSGGCNTTARKQAGCQGHGRGEGCCHQGRMACNVLRCHGGAQAEDLPRLQQQQHIIGESVFTETAEPLWCWGLHLTGRHAAEFDCAGTRVCGWKCLQCGCPSTLCLRSSRCKKHCPKTDTSVLRWR